MSGLIAAALLLAATFDAGGGVTTPPSERPHQVVTVGPVAAPADEVWRYVRDFSHLPTLVPDAVAATQMHAQGKAARWTITTADGRTIEERVVGYSDRARAMTYEMTDTPLPVTHYRATITVLPGANKAVCEVLFYTAFEASVGDAAALTPVFEEFQETFLANLAAVMRD